MLAAVKSVQPSIELFEAEVAMLSACSVAVVIWFQATLFFCQFFVQSEGNIGINSLVAISGAIPSEHSSDCACVKSACQILPNPTEFDWFGTVIKCME